MCCLARRYFSDPTNHHTWYHLLEEELEAVAELLHLLRLCCPTDLLRRYPTNLRLKSTEQTGE
jgi:hypothetical protein